jgi:diaminohydroxyphosphoribosylaminopyrimidine deaminase/5-amino-6-(5-phosphoribosylamino)uracil reductase
MVGAILVYNDTIIGEGWHELFGGSHAEVNAINSVNADQKIQIKNSTMFVSLEPCNFVGKTPACSELILKNEIKDLVISNIDHTPEVSGKSIEYLRSKGVQVSSGVLETEGKELSKFRNTFVDKNRPYIQIKYAVSHDGYIGKRKSRILLSNKLSDRFVHQLRSKTDAVLIGTVTAITDNPMLNTRYWPGKSPLKILIDPNLRVPLSNNVFAGTAKIKVFNNIKNEKQDHIEWHQIGKNENMIDVILSTLYNENIGTLLIEGGANTIQQFIDRGLYDEIYRIKTSKELNSGIKEPIINEVFSDYLRLEGDIIQRFLT